MHHLSISLFGPLLVLRNGQVVNSFTYQKARALLIYLLLEAARPHSRDELIGLLWPELPDTAARTNLRQALADLRKVLGDEDATPPYLLVTRDSLQFNATSAYLLDVTEFTTLLDSCERHLHRRAERCPICLERMQRAVADYHGDLLAGFMLSEAAPFEEWLLLKREAFHQRALTALTRLATACERRHQGEQAIQYARRQLELGPWREEAHQQLMRLYASSGQRSAALAQYVVCRSILAQELGVQPAAETVALYTQIQAGGWGSGAVGEKEPEASTPPLPYVPTPLFGREAELADLAELLANPNQRLITITGPGGIGKTRLALAAAATQADTFLHGAVFVDLTAISTPDLLSQAILQVLHQPLQGDQSPHAQLFRYLRHKAQALHYFQESLTILRALGDDRRIAQLLLAIAQMTHELYTDYGRARRYMEESLALAQKLTDTQITAYALQQLAELAFLQGDYEQGMRLLQDSLPLIRELGLKQDEGWALTALTETACHLGDYVAARRYGEAGRALFTALGFKSGLAITMHHLGLSALLAGEPTVAQAHFCEALHLSLATARQPMIARCLAGLCGVAIQDRDWTRAASLLSTAYILLNKLTPFLTPTNHAWYKEWTQITRTHLGETSFSAAWAAGQTMTLEQAVAYALNSSVKEITIG